MTFLHPLFFCERKDGIRNEAQYIPKLQRRPPEKQKLQWSPSSSLPLSSRNTDDRRHRRGWRSSSPRRGAPKLGNAARANATEHQGLSIYLYLMKITDVIAPRAQHWDRQGADLLRTTRRSRPWWSSSLVGRPPPWSLTENYKYICIQCIPIYMHWVYHHYMLCTMIKTEHCRLNWARTCSDNLSKQVIARWKLFYLCFVLIHSHACIGSRKCRAGLRTQANEVCFLILEIINLLLSQYEYERNSQ